MILNAFDLKTGIQAKWTMLSDERTKEVLDHDEIEALEEHRGDPDH